MDRTTFVTKRATPQELQRMREADDQIYPLMLHAHLKRAVFNQSDIAFRFVHQEILAELLRICLYENINHAHKEILVLGKALSALCRERAKVPSFKNVRSQRLLLSWAIARLPKQYRKTIRLIWGGLLC